MSHVQSNIDFDPYQILNLNNDPDIPIEVIKKQFYKLSLKYHPDRNKDCEDYAKEQFQQLQKLCGTVPDPRG